VLFRSAGTLYGRAQRYLHDVKAEVSREIEMEELRNLHKDVQDAAQSFQTGVNSFTSEVESTVSEHLGEVESAWRGDTAVMPTTTVSQEDLDRKAREFRRKKLVKTTGMPAWYKNRQGGRQHVLSGAARVRKFRPKTTSNTSFF